MTGLEPALSLVLRLHSPAVADMALNWRAWAGVTSICIAILMVASSGAGKPLLWRRPAMSLPLSGTEWVINVGCGTGVAPTAVAQRPANGIAVGIDLRRSVNRSR